MSRLEIACVTMHQRDFSKVEEMNIHSDVIFANQCDYTGYKEVEIDGHKARMISTETRGVGINRNLALTYAKGEICLFADDDLCYKDNVEEIVLREFAEHPDADVFIFHLDTTDSERKQKKYNRTRKCRPFERMPWGGCRIAVRLNSVRKANLWFTPLFGGGCIFPSGEDSLWLTEAKRKGLTFYVSKETIGTVSFENSTWFTGYDEKHFFGKGAFCAAARPRCTLIWILYYLFRYRNAGNLSVRTKLYWMQKGREGYRQMRGFEEIFH